MSARAWLSGLLMLLAALDVCAEDESLGERELRS
jgi:hypothetical protein